MLAAAALLAVPAQAAGRSVAGGSLLGGSGVVVDRAAPALPSVAASSYVIADADTGQVLAAKDPHGRYLPASTLKTLTSITMIPKLNPDALVRPTKQTVAVVPTIVGLSTARTYRVQDLFRAMLMISANDAALAVAQAGGGFTRTVAALNTEAKQLGADDTLAGSPNGLDNDLGLTIKDQHSSAYDLALIFRQGLSIPDFVKYIGTAKAAFPPKKTLTTHDKLLAGALAYPGMIGGKTGFTTAAGQNFVGAAHRNGHTIIIAQMHSANVFWADAKKLLDWGFRADGKVTPVGTLVTPAASALSPSATSQHGQPTPGSSGGTEAGWELIFPVTAAITGAVALWLYRRRPPS